MLTILWFLFVAFTIGISLVWLLDHNGSVIINWLGYEVKTDILTAILLAIFFALLIFAISYLTARILAIKFPNLLKLFFKRSYIKKLEKVVNRHWRGLDVMSDLLLSLEVKDIKSSINSQKKLSKLIKNPKLNNFFLGKINFDNKEFAKAAEFFSKVGEDKYAKNLVLKSKFKLSLEQGDEIQAIAYATQILSSKKDGIEMAKSLFILYKKRGLWQESKKLINQYGSDKFSDELQKRDIAVINTALALEAYRQKQFFAAIKHAKIAIKAEPNFLPAIEVILKSWIKKGFSFKASWMIKDMWLNNPHLIFAEIFDLMNRKSSSKNRIKAMKKLASLNDETHLGKLAIGLVAFRSGAKDEAREFLRLSLLKEKTYRAYKILSFVEKFSGDLEKSENYAKKAEMMDKDDHYTCNSCNHISSSWSAKCIVCDSYDSLEWNN